MESFFCQPISRRLQRTKYDHNYDRFQIHLHYSPKPEEHIFYCHHPIKEYQYVTGIKNFLLLGNT